MATLLTFLKVFLGFVASVSQKGIFIHLSAIIPKSLSCMQKFTHKNKEGIIEFTGRDCLVIPKGSCYNRCRQPVFPCLQRTIIQMFILIDNYDSFTWNLWHFLSDLGADVEIRRNDACSADDILAAKPQGIIVSPGPGAPAQAGITVDLIKKSTNVVPLLGVCLGHQSLAVAFGGTIKRVDPPVHGKLSMVERTHSNAVATDIFADCPQSFPVTRYHSLVVEDDALPADLTVTARTTAGAIMGLSHVSAELHGVQFHPESIASVAGYRILANFLKVCGHSVPNADNLAELERQTLRLDERFPDQMHP